MPPTGPKGRDDGDDRWRDVLFEMVKRAKGDAEFRARVEASGAVLDNFEAVLDRVRAASEASHGEVACQEYWWGFQLEIPNPILARWADGEVDLETVTTAIGTVPGPAGSFIRRAAAYVTSRIDELKAIDHGSGVHVSMTWMAPKIFVATSPRVRTK